MADPLWDDASCFFDPDLMGSLPDVRVPNASVEDWQGVLDLVAEKGWKCQYSAGGMGLPVPRAEILLSRPADAECQDLRVCRLPTCWRSWPVLGFFFLLDFACDLASCQRADRQRVPAEAAASGAAGVRVGRVSV
ncbi:hypothetical protein [Streptomyces shenzhenensis]|uniref:hypothetical protein n=1 Tax=Streptomyces shenzhenensis TaxID=943815 RepID=UPI002867FC40|nr:hypothetical protein [Streptomyces shenzhenensis]